MADTPPASPTNSNGRAPMVASEMECDYVIVGAGSAGCVLAARLSEDEQVNVCVLEAGGKDNNIILRMPLGVGMAISNKKFNWNYTTEGQAWLNNRCLFWPRGRVLGGSSSINGMVYIRGHARDYDHWRQLGLAGWSYADVLPYFRKAERNENGADTYHGGGGLLGVSNPTSGYRLFEDFVQAGVALGYPHTQDFNGHQQEGFGSYQLTTWKGERASAARAYLYEARTRANLDVKSSCLVQRVLFEGTRARGVAYEQGGRIHHIHARREVILCGGAVNSPQLLLLSGIGPAPYLQKFDIGVVADVPGVGQNLQDHLDVMAQAEVTKPISYASQQRLWRSLKIGVQYNLLRSGLGATNGLETGAFLKSDPRQAMPDIQFHFVAAIMRDHARQRIKDDGFSIHVTQLRPHARGYVALKSPDYRAHALIQPNYLSSPIDRKVMRNGLKLARQVLHTAPLGEHVKKELWPGADVKTNAQLDDFIRRTAETIYHPVGTCKMGTDKMAVLDELCRVRGVEGLRVIDASAMPSLVGGNTNAPTIMMAEKMADNIRGLPFRPPMDAPIAEDAA